MHVECKVKIELYRMSQLKHVIIEYNTTLEFVGQGHLVLRGQTLSVQGAYQLEIIRKCLFRKDLGSFTGSTPS